MNYSFIPPGKKTILKKVSRIWWGYIFLTLLIFGGFVGILKIQGYFMQQSTEESIAAQQEALENIKNFQLTLVEKEEIVRFGEYLASQNVLLKQSVENLFDLIPDQITLNKIEMERYQLTLYGITPSQQVYTFLLEVPLRSIFTQSRASFYMLPNGWYNFVSVSKLEPEEGKEE